MSQSSWIIEQSTLCLLLPSGEKIFPTAQDVYKAIFQDSPTTADTVPLLHPIRAFPDLAFSRYPMEVEIRLEGDLASVITARIAATDGSISSPLNLQADQIIIGNTWFPIQPVQVQDTIGWFSAQGLENDQVLSFGQFLALRGARDCPVQIRDFTISDPIRVSAAVLRHSKPASGLNATPYPYQEEGIAFLKMIASQGLGCVLADEMGLGKTLQVIGLLASVQNHHPATSLVIAPATLMENWRRELDKFAPQLKTLVHAGSDRAGISERLVGYDVLITSYDTAVRDELILSSLEWNVLVLDEAQNIKNPHAQRTLAVKRFPRQASIAVTGTPVENRLDDLWSLADFVLPGLLGDISSFRTTFDDDLGDAAKLADIVAPIILRRRVADVAKDLPARIDVPEAISMGRDLSERYEIVRLQSMEQARPSDALASMMRLRMFCTHPNLSTYGTEDPSLNMPKYLRLLELLEEIFDCDQKALVFTSFQGMIDLLMEDIPTRWRNYFFACIDGRTAVGDRQSIVDTFNNSESPGALFLNPKAAGTGLNITSANHVIHYNPEWNPALTAQATARAYRRKQLRPVTVRYLFFPDSIEEVIMGKSQFKRMLANEAITTTEDSSDVIDIWAALQMSPLSSINNK